MTTLQLPTANVQLPRVFAALGDNTRYKIFELLTKDSDICVGTLAGQLGITPSAVSQQCKLLELTGLVSRERRGQLTCYQVNDQDPQIKAVIGLMKEQS